MLRLLHFSLLLPVLAAFWACDVGTSKQKTEDEGDAAAQVEAPKPDTLDLTVGQGPIEPAAYELRADRLMESALAEEQLSQGWVRLLDGQTLAGWNIMGQADWQCKDGVLRVTRGDVSFLSTSFEIADCELHVEFRAAPKTNSGIFLRAAPEPGDPSLNCIEVNIAPPDNEFPTGSAVGRQRVEPDQLGSDFDPTAWHAFVIRAEGENVTIHLDGKKLLELVDDTSSRRGFISLQHNEGIVEFRNILMRPIDHRALKVGEDWADDWTADAKEDDSLKVELIESGLHIQGGLGKVQSRDSFGDFLLQAKYSLATPDVNSGIFFRCMEDAMLDGYECQINHAIQDNDPLRPKDGGTGAIFRRRDARIVVGDGTRPTYLTLLASGNQFVTWVNGLLTAEFYDDRPADENPRNGSRLDAGPIAIQGHDPATDITIHDLRIAELR